MSLAKPLEKSGRNASGFGGAVRGAQRADVRDHRVHAAGGFDGVPGDADDDAHFQHELKEVGPEHAREAAERNVNSGERDQEENADDQSVAVRAGKYWAENIAERAGKCAEEAPGLHRGAERGADDVDHGLGDPAEDQAVHQQTEIDGAKSAQKRGGLSGVAHFGELHVGHQAGATPQAREEKDRHHSGRQKRPPDPVAGDSLGVDEAGDEQRRIGGESGGDHGSAGEPPGNGASGDKIIFGAFSGAAAEIEAEEKSYYEVTDNG